jgi:hypothetical protein
MIDSSIAPTTTEPILKPSIEKYLSHVQVQPLTDLMVDIIIFQMRERALFTDIDMPVYCLN